MNKEDNNREYWDWVAQEKQEASEAYQRFITSGTRLLGDMGTNGRRRKTRYLKSIITAAAAVIFLALVSTVLLNKERLFKPQYTEEQIALSYEHSIKTLALFSEALSKGSTPLKPSLKK